jgi:hypothetical protein
LNTISVSELAGKKSSEVLRVDVRSAAEFASGHVVGAVNIPLDEIEGRTGDLGPDRPIALICQMASGHVLPRICWNPVAPMFSCSTAARRLGRTPACRLSKASRRDGLWERQIRLAAGILVLSGSVLAALVNPYWLILTGFVGTGLTLAGLTDVCPMAAVERCEQVSDWHQGEGSKQPKPSIVCRGLPADNSYMDFERLVNEHKDAVYRQMIRACGNRKDAEDVLIEALLKAYRNLDQLRAHQAFRAWLAQIGRRVCWQLKKREALLPLLQLSELESEGQEFREEHCSRRDSRDAANDGTADECGGSAAEAVSRCVSSARP